MNFKRKCVMPLLAVPDLLTWSVLNVAVVQAGPRFLVTWRPSQNFYLGPALLKVLLK